MLFDSAPTGLETASWALVGATALLVVANAIPAIRGLAQSRSERKRLGAALVPDMHMLHSRLRGTVDELLGASAMDADDLEEAKRSTNRSLEVLHGVIEGSAEAGLKFSNEVYICRHLLTQASFEIERALELEENHQPFTVEDARRRDAALARALRLYLAADNTLTEAETLLPKGTRDIDGEEFWDRFSRVAKERELEAEKALVDRR